MGRAEAADTNRAWIELSRGALRRNVEGLSTLLPPGGRLMPALKANAYGHGAPIVARELNSMGVQAFCVATIDEGIELRRGGVRGEILVLGRTHPDRVPQLIEHRLTQSVADLAHGRELNDGRRALSVHLAVDTGIRRNGEPWDHYDNLLTLFRCENLAVRGIYTHLSHSGAVDGGSRRHVFAQADAFRMALAVLNAHGCRYGKTHLLASAGLLNYPELGGDDARPGIALYGLMNRRDAARATTAFLTPALSLRARITTVHRLHAGQTAGYEGRFTAPNERDLAVVPLGFGDGIPRALSCGRGHGLVRGHRASVAGLICMDSMFLDVTGIPGVGAGDVVTFIGRDGDDEASAYDLAEAGDTITGEFLCRLGSRLPRVVAP